MSKQFLRNIRGYMVAGVVIGLIIGGLSYAFQKSAQPRILGLAARAFGSTQFSYIAVRPEKMIQDSDYIFVGKVAEISQTRWNQDSGEPGNNDGSGFGMNYHTVQLDVSEWLVNMVDQSAGSTVTLTVLGISPLDGEADHSLQIGDQVVVFAAQRELAWRDGTRPIIRLTNAPSISYLVLGEDGKYHGLYIDRPEPVSFELAEIIQQIAEQKPALISVSS